MQIAVHLGLHCAQADRLTKALLRNAGALAQRGAAVPPPSRYRDFLSQVLADLGDAHPADGARDVVLDAMLDDLPDRLDRLVISHESLISNPRQVFENGAPYSHAAQRLRAFARLFDGDDLSFYIGLRNPAEFLPALAARTGCPSVSALTGGLDPTKIAWAPIISQIRAAVPNAAITVWCHEDTPLIWGEVVRAVAGLPTGTKIAGAFEVLASVMPTEGMQHFREFLVKHAHISESKKRRVMAAFLKTYTDAPLPDPAPVPPGWSTDYIEALTDLYESDILEIAAMQGVHVIDP